WTVRPARGSFTRTRPPDARAGWQRSAADSRQHALRPYISLQRSYIAASSAPLPTVTPSPLDLGFDIDLRNSRSSNPAPVGAGVAPPAGCGVGDVTLSKAVSHSSCSVDDGAATGPDTGRVTGAGVGAADATADDALGGACGV